MRRCLGVVIVSLAVLVVAPACGGSGKKPIAVLSAAATNTVQSKSSRVALTIQTSPSPATGNKSATLTGEGAFDYASRKGTLTMDTSAMGIPGVSGQIELVLLGDLFYLKLPPGILGTKPWLKIDLATAGEQTGIDLGGLQDLGRNDPASNLQFLQGASNDVKKIGSEQVRGVATTRYHLIVDLERAKTKVSTNLRPHIDRVIKQIGRSTYPADVWIDDRGLIRRLRFNFSSTTTSAAGATAAVVTQEFYDFGVAVSAEAPPADQVNDFAQLLSQLGASGA